MQRIIVFIVSLFVIIALHAFGVLDPVEKIIIDGLSPIFERARGVSVQLTRTPRGSNDRILFDRVIESEKSLALTATALQENEALKAMISYKDRAKVALIAARVLGSSTDPLRSMIRIDKGSRDGVRKGSAVIVNDGVLVGTIADTDAHTSSVLLLNDSRSKVIATFADGKSPRGIVEGQFQLGLRMNLIPITDTVQEGSLLMTSGRQQGIPASLVIGTIASIQSKPTDLFQSALITPSISYDDLRFVSVIPAETDQ